MPAVTAPAADRSDNRGGRRDEHLGQAPSARPQRSDSDQITASDRPLKLSDQLEEWLTGDGEKTLEGLVDAFGDKSFAILLVLLLGVPALPLPTGG